MLKYHGFFLASVISVWVVVLVYVLRTWRREHRIHSR